MTNSKAPDPPRPGEDDRQICIDCSVVAPETETNYTLISQRHGWRLTRVVDAAGRRSVEWRCPKCFNKHRDKQPPKR